ncbi:hypothetical protein [Mycolicibacterium elephantis]|uniref:Uncharacterized protein n=1 Tax=Mycolicibacterium elephantis DSM 44368 TaxID=1335622 RepID=A0A439E0W9_9MYCO|nr:hypothetical protein [Mycolicibacterium elephantis]MCV7221608.1 hypothetical protein [Mycolicibacterium elephantis]RWA24047.1 hypothetical protein MELE44368_02210 [Mycolicibacterium elephantis DSM 44368]
MTAETRADAPETGDQPDTPPDTDTAATDTLSADTDTPAADDAQHQDDGGDEHQDDGDDGNVVGRRLKKLRHENATLRQRAKTAEATVEHLQRQSADKAIKAAGLKPAAVWAIAELADVLDGRGGVDDRKLAAAIKQAAEQLGVQPPKRRTPRPGAGSPLRSGAGIPEGKPRGFADAFAPAHRNNT